MKHFMKKLVFVLAVTLSVVGLRQNVFAEKLITVDETTFPDKVFREAVVTAWNIAEPEDWGTKHDEGTDVIQIDAELIKSVSAYDTSSSGAVANLKGIELLPNLESLYLNNYTGGKINLSKNTNLTNVNITSKKYVLSPNDFASLPKLVSLGMYDKVASTVDVSKLKKLKDIRISSKTGAKKVDVSKCSKLQDLSLYTNSMTSVNLGSSKELTKVHIQGAKKLTSVNVTKLTNLTYLVVRDCNISKIDISKNKKLESFAVNGNKKVKSVSFKNNQNLTWINLGYTGVTKLDTSKRKKLMAIEVYNTKISSLNLKKNTKMYSVDVANTLIKSLDISNCKKLNYINIAGSKIKSLNMKNQKEMYGLTYTYGQKITFPSKITRDYCWIDIEGVKKGSSIVVPAFCKGYKFSSNKEYSLTYKNNKIITSKKTKKKYAYASFTKGNKSISFSIKYK